MKKLVITTVTPVVFAGCLLGSQLDVSISGFADPAAFLSESVQVRFAELVPANGTNQATHVLIEGLSPLADGSSNYASTYSGINVTTGAIQDSGMVYLIMPNDGQPPEGTIVSPIVGVVQRTGDWSSTFPSATMTDISSGTGATPAGTANYNGSTISFNLSNGTDQFTAVDVSYQKLDTDTILLDPFTLNTGGFESHQMSESVLIRDGDRFSGTLTNLEDTPSYNSLIYTIELDNIPDLDMDLIPDFSDPVLLLDDAWSRSDIGWIWTHSEDVCYSLVMGWVSLADYPVIYHYQLDAWFQVMPAPVSIGGILWMHSPTLGWIYTETGWFGDFFKSSGGWVLDNFHNPIP